MLKTRNEGNEGNEGGRSGSRTDIAVTSVDMAKCA